MNKTDEATKKAWEENWDDVSMKQIMEIFTYVRVKKQIAIFLKFLPVDKILEGGCGLAPYIIRLRQLGYDVEGIDYNSNTIERVLRHNPSLPVRVGNVEHIPYPSNYFGGYLSLGVIEHFMEGPEKAINEAWRVLKPDGIFIVMVPIWNIFLTLSAPIRALKEMNWIRRLLKKDIKVRYWQQYFKQKYLRNKLNASGFEVLEVHALDHTHALASFSHIFRDEKTFDEANPLGIKLGCWLERNFPWTTAAQMMLVCRKIMSCPACGLQSNKICSDVFHA